MLTRKNLFVAVVFSVALAFVGHSQQRKVDSLAVVLEKYNHNHKDKPLSSRDSVKVILLNDLYYYTVNYEQDRAFDYATEALEVSKKINYKKGIANGYSNLARIYNARANFDLAIDNLHQSTKIFTELNDDHNLANNYAELGVVFSKKGNFPEAINNLIKALKKYEKAGDDLSVGYTYNNIGISYKQRKEYEKALDYYYKGLKIFKKINNTDARYGIAGTSSNIGNVYLAQGQHEKSLNILYESLKLAEEFDNSYQFAESYQSIGENYMKLGKYDIALESYSKAIDYCNEIKDNAGIANSHINIGYCYFKKGDAQKAISNINTGLAIAKKVGLLQWQNDAYQYLSEIYNSQSNYKLAYENQVLFKKINDSLFNTDKEKKITQMQMQYDFDKIQDKEQQVQKEKVQKLNQETDKQRTIKYAVMIAFLFMCLLTFGIFFNLKKNQKQKSIIAEQKQTVEKQNEVIQQSLTEKETLLREIHHRVKNNLQIISSLLNIQSQHIVDENVLSSIQEGQSRVQAMSLIHQNLYQSEHLSNVDIENYLRELMVYLSEMFVGESKSIDVEVEASNIQFDIDTAIPLGLIVNELVSNAYKYAFDKRNSGRIKVKITSLNEVDYELDVNDDGTGLPTDFDPKKSKSLGLKLVGILSRQLRGTMSFNSDNGTSFVVKFKDIKAYQSSI
ncbi:two-component sensor histidine kinase [Flavobacterium arsenatis]|uniref:Two-component sensor histidine kinase n=1 Tax=Flavobacterium arsenatis TaxID=1484332 RepID=A0ABU1TP38_9FLAO|nr:tetratricopeptide repeat protein [Flavobacterium arsenatis]MDR6967701.1 two-component sensor histidine kinase [Flavobacterium arsenatis]